jgi:hypothetical protein
MEKLTPHTVSDDITTGSVYIMTHSFFSDVIRIDCTPDIPQKSAKRLSANSPGEYTIVFSLVCKNPCDIKKKIESYLIAQKYINEFYQVSPDVASKLLLRETLKIPTLITQ